MYQDILYEKRYVSPNRAGMSRADRAAQFSAFAALTGFDGVIRETGRLTQQEIFLDEDEKMAINLVLQQLMEEPEAQLRVVWFCPDSQKSGGVFLHYTGKLKRLDLYERVLCFWDGARIAIDRICKLERVLPEASNDHASK